MITKPVRIGVIGVGFGTRVQIPGFQSEGFEVVAVCSRQRERAEEAAKNFGIPNTYTDYREMLSQPGLDAVSIVTPPNLHHEMTIAALEAGKHVLCEKPFAMDQQQAKEMWDKAQETKLTGMVTHEFRFAPARAYVKELLQQGYIGELLNVSITFFLLSGRQQRPGHGPLEWRRQYSQGGGELAGIGSHYIDCLRDWFGEVNGVCGRVFNHSLALTPEGKPKSTAGDADNAYGFLVTFANEGWGSMASSSVVPFGSGVRIEIYGSEGALSTPQAGTNPEPNGVVLGTRSGETKQLQELPIPQRFRPFPDNRDPRLAAFRILLRRFRLGISEGTSPAPSFSDGYCCQQVIDAVRGSNTSGRWVEIH